MKTYKELKDNFFEEVAKIDTSKLTLASYGNSYKEYAELLRVMAEIPDKTTSDRYDLCCCQGFGGAEVPKIDEGGK